MNPPWRFAFLMLSQHTAASGQHFQGPATAQPWLHCLDGAAAAPATHLVIHHLADQIVRRIIHAAGQLLRHGMLSARAHVLGHSLVVPVLARGTLSQGV